LIEPSCAFCEQVSNGFGTVGTALTFSLQARNLKKSIQPEAAASFAARAPAPIGLVMP
jgi:hypothetical protein